MRKPTICIGDNKDANQIRGNPEADQRLCFRCTDSTLPLLLKSEISSFKPASVTAHCTGRFIGPVGNHIVGFLTKRLKCARNIFIVLWLNTHLQFSQSC